MQKYAVIVYKMQAGRGSLPDYFRFVLGSRGLVHQSHESRSQTPPGRIEHDTMGPITVPADKYEFTCSKWEQCDHDALPRPQYTTCFAGTGEHKHRDHSRCIEVL